VTDRMLSALGFLALVASVGFVLWCVATLAVQ
jgi:hypothetical protein